jgi:hypothetical protein
VGVAAGAVTTTVETDATTAVVANIGKKRVVGRLSRSITMRSSFDVCCLRRDALGRIVLSRTKISSNWWLEKCSVPAGVHSKFPLYRREWLVFPLYASGLLWLDPA